MARISKYEFDKKVTKDDFVIGSDSITKKTKNYKIQDILQILIEDTGIDAEEIQSILDRLSEIESQFVLTNNEITGLNTNEVLYQSADRTADLQFTTNTFATETETINGSDMYYIEFNHNLNKYPSIIVTESGSPEQFCIVPVKYIDLNTVRVYFKGKTSGKLHAN
jgi:hypothetical protein